MKRGNRFLILTVVLALTVMLAGCASTPVQTTLPAATEFCTVSVVVDTSISIDTNLPSDGVILPPSEVGLQPDDSVLDVLVRAVASANPEHGADNVRTIGYAYVSGIGNDSMSDLLFEKDAGPNSGWLYSIDGTYPGVGADSHVVQPGEIVVWEYTRELGGA